MSVRLLRSRGLSLGGVLVICIGRIGPSPFWAWGKPLIPILVDMRATWGNNLSMESLNRARRGRVMVARPPGIV